MLAWVWVPIALFLFCCGCFALVWVAILGGKHHDQRIDAMVHVASGPLPGCDCDDCEDMREHMRDRPDCAESCCWELRLDEMVERFDWPAAEAEFERRRP